jgi:hypothetical protein
MFLSAPLGNVEGRMAGMFVGSWTLVMQSQQVGFVGTQRIVGVMRQLRPLTARMTY